MPVFSALWDCFFCVHGSGFLPFVRLFFLKKMPFFFTSPPAPAEWWLFCFSDGDFFVLATVFFVLVVVHLRNKLSHRQCMFSSTWRCLRHEKHGHGNSCADGLSALNLVLGLRQAAAANICAVEGEVFVDVILIHVGAAILGGSGAIFWTTALTQLSFRSILWTWVFTVAAKRLSFDGPLQIEGAIKGGVVISTRPPPTVFWKGELIWALAGV